MVTRRAILWYALLILGLPIFAIAQEVNYQFGSEVKNGDLYRLRLTGLTSGVKLNVQIETSARTRFLLVSETEMKRFPSIQTSVFDLTTGGEAEIAVWIPEDGDYFLLVDNRNNTIDIIFSFVIEARV